MNRAQRAKTIAGALGAGRSGRKAVGKAVKVGQAVRKGNKAKSTYYRSIRWRQTMADLPGLRPQVVSPGRLRMVPEAMASKGRCGPGPAPSIT